MVLTHILFYVVVFCYFGATNSIIITVDNRMSRNTVNTALILHTEVQIVVLIAQLVSS
jgi:hypothetical protein